MIRILISLFLSVLFLSCSDSAGVTGSGTGVGNGITVSGVVKDSTNTPLEAVALELVPHGYLPPLPIDSRQTIYTGTSGAGGIFQFDSVSAGLYKLWARSGDSALGVVSCDLDGVLEDTVLDAVTLQSPVAYSVKLIGGSTRAAGVVRIYGSTYAQTCSVGETVTLHLPEGGAVCRVDIPGYLTLTGDTISLLANDTVPVYLLDGEQNSYCYHSDSLIVETVLRANGLDSLTVEEVTYAPFDDDDDDDCDDRRVIKLTLTNVHMLPAITGKMIALHTLSLTDGTLQSLPSELGNLRYLRRLDLRNNELHTLPATLMELENLDTVYVEGNPLDSLSVEMASWLAGLEDDD